MNNFSFFEQEIKNFLMDENADLLATFDEFKTSIKNSPPSVSHSNTAHANTNRHTNTAHSNHQNHSNNYSQGHGNTNWENLSWYSCWYWYNAAYNHVNDAYHSNSGHSNAPHSDTAARNTHANTTEGYDHNNYIPAKPQFYTEGFPTYFKGNVSIKFFSYEKTSADTVYYTVYARKGTSGTWYEIADGSAESITWNTLNPLASGMDMNGTFQLKAVAYNNKTITNARGAKTTRKDVSGEVTQEITLKQNTSPTITVSNGGNFINFVFGQKVYNGSATSTYTDKFGQDNLLVNIKVVDVDTDNYLKGWADILVNGSVVKTKAVTWSDNGKAAIQANGSTGRTGYALFTKSELSAVSSNADVTVRVRVQDYMESACTNACDTIVTQTKAGGSNMAFALDFSAPTLTVAATESNYAQSCTVTFTKTDSGKAGADYVLVTLPDGTTTTTTANTYKATQSGKYTFVLYDKAGNASAAKTLTFSKIDTSKPTLTVTQNTTSAAQSVIFTFTKTDAAATATSAQSGTKHVVVTKPDGTTETVTGDTYTATKNGTYKFVLYDNANNASSAVSKTVNNIDTLKPTLSVGGAESSWSQGVTYTFTTSDATATADSAQSGVKHVTVTAPDGTKTNVTTGSFKATMLGTYTFVAYDNAGNASTAVTKTLSKVDTVKPTLSVTSNESDYAKTVTFTFTKTDGAATTTSAQSGVKHVVVTKPDGTTETVTGNTYTVSKNGTYKFVAYDNANNASTAVSKTVSKIDTLAPSITVSGYQDTVYSQEVKLTFATSDATATTASAKSGVDYVLITKPDGSTIKHYLNEYVVTANGTYKFQAVDAAGNISSATTYQFTKIDRIAPVINPVQTNKTGWVAKAEITFTTSDNLSGTSQVFVRKAGETIKHPYAPNAKFTTKENATYYVSAVDSAGNMSGETAITISNVDMVAPTCTVEYVSPSANQYVESVDILITGVDSESGIKSIHLPTGQAIFSDTYVFKATANATYNFYVVDNAGNKSQVNSIAVNNIDTSGVKVSVSKSYDPTTGKVSIKFTMEDEESGVVRLITPTESIELNGGTKETATVEVSENGTYTYQIVNGIGKVVNYRVTVNECPGAGINSFQIVNVVDEDGTGSMLAPGSVLPSISAGVYKGAYVTLQAITINSPDEVLFSLSGASSAYVLDNVSASRGATNDEWLFTFQIADMTVENAVIEVEAQAVSGGVYSQPKTVTVNLVRDRDGEPVANIIG